MAAEKQTRRKNPCPAAVAATEKDFKNRASGADGRMKRNGKEENRASGGIRLPPFHKGGSGLKEAALRLFGSFRAHTKKELRRKLTKGFSAIETAGDNRRTQNSILDDRIFSKNLAVSRSKNKNWGSGKIASELRNKGVERELIKEGYRRGSARKKNAFGEKCH